MSYFTLTLDTAAPANPSLLIAGGAAVTGDQVVPILLATPSLDVDQMKLWGDVDQDADPLIQQTEATSFWIDFRTDVAVRLSDFSGRKTIYARLRDDVGNETLAFSDFIDLDLSAPVVHITTGVDRGRISKVAGFDAATFTWEATQDFDRYEVRVVPSTGSPQQAGTIVPVTGGSLNVVADGPVAAYTPIITTIRGSDLQVASPGDGNKVVKVFVRDMTGKWSS